MPTNVINGASSASNVLPSNTSEQPPAADDIQNKTNAAAQAVLTVQSDTTRCWSCHRKVGLLGFKCKCQYVFCSHHRYAEQHACTFDFKTAAREQLRKNNPEVSGTKIIKI